MLTQHIALVPEGEGVDVSQLARVSAALQKQVMRDLSPIWGITASVDLFLRLEEVPIGYWPIIVTASKLGSLAGVHLDKSGQPYAQIELAGSWSHAASRACLEMLVNPFESRTVVAASPRSEQGPVSLLVEVCGPCEDTSAAYRVDDVLVSDFCTPAFFMLGERERRYSWNGSLTAPLQQQRGGHITWYDPMSASYWLRSHWGDNPIDTGFGEVDRKVISVRELVQACTPLRPESRSLPPPSFDVRQYVLHASQARAQNLVALLGERIEHDLEAAFAAAFVEAEVRDVPLLGGPLKPRRTVRALGSTNTVWGAPVEKRTAAPAAKRAPKEPRPESSARAAFPEEAPTGHWSRPTPVPSARVATPAPARAAKPAPARAAKPAPARAASTAPTRAASNTPARRTSTPVPTLSGEARAPAASSVAPVSASTPQASARANQWVGPLAGGLAAAAILAWALNQRPESQEPQAQAAPVPAATVAQPPSVLATPTTPASADDPANQAATLAAAVQPQPAAAPPTPAKVREPSAASDWDQLAAERRRARRKAREAELRAEAENAPAESASTARSLRSLRRLIDERGSGESPSPARRPGSLERLIDERR